VQVTLQVQLGTATEADTTKEETTVGTTNTVDPVCGMTVAPETAAASREVDGTTYYFCSAHCAASFDADPQRYTTASADK
jgi:Cu+-exporting ATPase